jgi:hypothetical protein
LYKWVGRAAASKWFCAPPRPVFSPSPDRPYQKGLDKSNLTRGGGRKERAPGLRRRQSPKRIPPHLPPAAIIIQPTTITTSINQLNEPIPSLAAPLGRGSGRRR